MSIASQLEALSTNLTAAKNAVTTKGGTVGDTGLAGLASEIATIPSGGTEDWGEVTFKTSAMESPQTVTIGDEDEYNLLSVYNAAHTIGGESFYNTDILSVKLGTSASYAPRDFLRGASSMTTITGVDNLRVILDDFLYNCVAINSELDFKNLHSVGINFMYGCSAFNSTLKLGKITYIAGHFMDGCTAFAQTLTVPASVGFVDVFFMNNCNNVTSLVVNAPSSNTNLKTSNNTLATTDNTAPIYSTGVTLTGTEASRWKNRFEDRTSSPYRKLILGV